MSETKAIGGNIVIKNVRIAFAQGVFTPSQFQGTGDPRYSCTFLVKPGSENDKLIQSEIQKAVEAKWEKKAQLILESIPHGSQSRCYYKGDLKEYDGFAGHMALSAVRQLDKGAPLVIDRDKSELHVQDGRPYSGCYVNAKVQIWAQDNNYGKGIRCTLVAVQFVKDGEAFGAGGPATAEGFDEVEEEAGDLV